MTNHCAIYVKLIFFLKKNKSLLILQLLKVVAEKADEYIDPGLGIYRTNGIETQERKEIEGTSENQVQVAEDEGQAGLRKRIQSGINLTRRRERAEGLEGRVR